MPSATAPAAAPGLPKHTDILSTAVTSRRGFLTSAATISVLGPISAEASPPQQSLRVVQENPRLLAIGRELDELIENHQAADIALQEAEDLALKTCPPVPDTMKPDARHPHFRGTVRVDLEAEVNALGEPVGPFQTIRGQRHPVGTVASSRAIEKIIACAYEPEAVREQMDPHLAIARAYEAERDAALHSAGLPHAIAGLNDAARAVWNLVDETMGLPASTPAGVLVKARVLQAAATVWDEQGGSQGRLLAAAASQGFVASVIEILQPAIQ